MNLKLISSSVERTSAVCNLMFRKSAVDFQLRDGPLAWVIINLSAQLVEAYEKSPTAAFDGAELSEDEAAYFDALNIRLSSLRHINRECSPTIGDIEPGFVSMKAIRACLRISEDSDPMPDFAPDAIRRTTAAVARGTLRKGDQAEINKFFRKLMVELPEAWAAERAKKRARLNEVFETANARQGKILRGDYERQLDGGHTYDDADLVDLDLCEDQLITIRDKVASTLVALRVRLRELKLSLFADETAKRLFAESELLAIANEIGLNWSTVDQNEKEAADIVANAAKAWSQECADTEASVKQALTRVAQSKPQFSTIKKAQVDQEKAAYKAAVERKEDVAKRNAANVKRQNTRKANSLKELGKLVQ